MWSYLYCESILWFIIHNTCFLVERSNSFANVSKVCFCVKVGLMLCHVYILRRWRSWSLKKRRVVLLGALRTTGTRAWPECNSWIWSTSMCDGLSASVVTIPNPSFENFSLHLDPTISHIYIPKSLHHSFIHLPSKFYFLHFPRSTLRVMAQRRFEWQLFDLWFGQVGPGWNGGWILILFCYLRSRHLQVLSLLWRATALQIYMQRVCTWCC